MAMRRRSMKKAMKAMKKAKKSMKKSMRRRAMKVSIRKYKTRSGANRAVFNGKFAKTSGGLQKSALTKNKNGKIVSKKKSARGKASKWIAAVAKARKALGIKGFCAVGGKAGKGKALLAKARSFYK